MERNELKAINQAFANSALAGGGALAGLTQLCTELVAAGAIAPDAAARVGKAIIADINGTPQAEWQARNRMVGAVQALFAQFAQADGTTPEQP